MRSTHESERQSQTASPLPISAWTAYSLHDEGDGLWALHVASLPALLLAELEARLDLDTDLYDARRAWGVHTWRPVPSHELLFLGAPSEIVHSPQGPPDLGTCSVLVDPHAALPEGAERRLAFVFYDADRAVLYTRDREVLRIALDCWVGGVIEDLAELQELPRLDNSALDALIDPVGAGAWREIHLQKRSSSWLCELRGFGAPTRTWIGSPESGWRIDWSW